MLNEPDWNLVRGVLVDAVGTLMEPVPSVAEAYTQAARRQKVDLSVHVVRDRFRKAFSTDELDDQSGPMRTDEAVERRRWQRIVATCLPEVPDQIRAFEELWAHFAHPGSWMAFPDAGPALRRLSEAGLAVMVASNFDARLRSVLKGLPSLSRWSERVVISSEVGYRKPHPEFFRKACERLGLAAESVLVVGDDRENDLEGPIRAGLQAVLVERSAGGEPDRSTLRELLEVAERLTPG